MASSGTPDSKAHGGGGKVLGRLKRAATGEAPPPPEPAPTVFDSLTGLPIRDHLPEWMERAIRQSTPTSSRAVIAFIAIERLRDVNDSYGADAGDQMLRLVAERLKSIDLPGTEVLRYGGAEFALIFPKLNHAQASQQIAEFLVDLMGRPFEYEGDQITLASTVGTAISADNYENFTDIILDAHRALAHARDEGLKWHTHDETQRGRYETRIDETRLQKALENDEFLLHYQPIVKSETGELVGFEALLRWKAPGATNAGVMGPSDFLPILEKSGLVVHVGRWAVQEACRQIAEWNDLGFQPFPLFVTINVSPRQLADPEFVEQTTSAIRESGIQPELLCLDLTEHCLRVNSSDTWPPLRELSTMGVRLSLDDFGQGVTSLHWLLELSLDFVRIERNFVAALGANVRNEERGLPDPVKILLTHVTNMTRDLGIEVIAEGVETAEEAEAVRAVGIPFSQGYMYGYPESAEAARVRVDPSQEKIHVWDPNDVLEAPIEKPPSDSLFER